MSLPLARAGPATAAVAQRWMEMVLGEKFSRDFAAELRLGYALCALAGKVFKALGMKEQVLALASPAGSEALGHARRRSGGSDRMPRGATQRVRAYLSACDLLGVDVDDMFEPDDLLRSKDLGKVYRNILALQAVAVSLSTRRSIDERSSLGAKPTFSPISDQGMAFLHDDGFESPPLIDRVQHMSWQQLLFEYEHQQMQKELENTGAADPSASEGLGQLAHDIWGTEERIRARLILEDREFGVVPDGLHGKLWMLASGAETELRRHPGQYEQLVAVEEETTDATRQIDVDLFRTVPQADKDRWSDEKTQQLRRVLVAYSHYNPTLGYCQGLNYIVARMLQFLSEEEAFYLLTKMVAQVPEDYYTTMLGLAVDQHVFADLVRLQMPDITAHLTGLGGSGVELSLACTEWFLTLFASPCDREVTIHIWDSIFLLGDELLFRVALALMQLEKSSLLACENYGDMLKHLNEIGRGKTDGYDLLKLAREQDCVYRARIEDFRAHHRLQLASGIVASAVESEGATATSSTGRPSADSSKPENKIKQIIGRPKKHGHGIFRHLAGRTSRTFERYITEDYSVKLQLDHPNAAFYYNGVAPMVFDRYWGSKESYNQWGLKNTRVVTGMEDDEPELERRRRLQSESATVTSASNHRASAMNATDTLGQSRAIARERRSKSTAFINSKKHSSSMSNGSSSTQSPSLTSTGADEMHQYGRSPRTWIQKFEDWHRELKTQKEKKKAEKRRNKLDSRGDSTLASTSAVSRSSQKERTSNVRRTRKSFSSSPSRSHSLDHRGTRRESEGSERARSPADRKSASAGPRTKEPTELTELPLSRSFSDPFHSPDGVLGRSPWQHPAKRELQDDIDSQILIRSMDTHSQDFQRQERIAEHAERGRSRREQHQPVSRTRNGSNAENVMPRAGSFQYAHPHAAVEASAPLRKTTIGSYPSRAIPISGRKSEEKLTAGGARRTDPDMRRPPRRYPKGSSSSSSSSNPYDGELSLSPMFSQLRSSELLNGTDYDVLRNPYSQLGFRRNLSLPDGPQQQQSQPSSSAPKRVGPRVVSKRPPPAESARVIRDRAHVVSYMQRKLSDASSLAGSISRSPREQQRADTSRLSASSSNSSRASDQVFGSNRSGLLSLPYRKGSFSFFDKLSSDLESCLGDINRSYPSSEVDFGGGGGGVQSDDVEDVGSMTLPLPAKSRATALEEFRRRSSFTGGVFRRSFQSGKE